jgi:acyl-CoA reductase-like NAD-dependent aldehyde dehydrogenase
MEEIVGPVLSIIALETLDDAIHLIGSSPAAVRRVSLASTGGARVPDASGRRQRGHQRHAKEVKRQTFALFQMVICR